MSEEPMVEIRLIRLPLGLHREAIAHGDALRRELALLAADTTGAWTRLDELSASMAQRYSPFTQTVNAAIEDATNSGLASIDLTFHLPADIADAAETLESFAKDVDHYCADGELITLVTPAGVRAYRQWFLREFVRQARDGAPPLPWPGYASEVEQVPEHVEGHPEPSVLFSDDLDYVGAARLRGVLAERIEHGASDLAIDLAGCTFLDSVGASLLLSTRARCHERGGAMTLLNASAPVVASLQMMGVLDLFVIGSRDLQR